MAEVEKGLANGTVAMTTKRMPAASKDEKRGQNNSSDVSALLKPGDTHRGRESSRDIPIPMQRPAESRGTDAPMLGNRSGRYSGDAPLPVRRSEAES